MFDVFWVFFYGGRENLNSSIRGSSLVFCWHADDGQTLNAGLVALRFSAGPDLYC